MKKLTKLMSLLVMLTMSVSVWGDWSLSYKQGAEGAWTYNVNPYTDGKVHLNLEANATYFVYVVVDGNGWASGDATMTFGNSSNYDLSPYGDGTYTALKVATKKAGEYLFSLSWFDEKQHMTVEYPYGMYLPGSWNEWALEDAVQFDANNMLTMHLGIGSYSFKAVNNDGWYGNGGTMNGPQKAWEFTDANSNCTLNITEEGDYTFSYGWMNNSKPRINVFRANENMVSSSTAQQSAYNAIDADGGSRWESVSNDDQWWLVKYAEPQTFDNVVINWEGAYGKQFNILGSNDGVNWTNLYTETNQTSADEHTYELTETAVYQWVKFQGVKRATGYGYSFFDFKTVYLNVPVPTNVAVSTTGRLSFDYEGEADSYVARIYYNSALIVSQDVVSNDVLNFVPEETGTYQVKVVAKVGENTSKESVAYDWSVEAGHVYGVSKYCDWVFNTTENGGYPLYITWITEPNGDMKVTIDPVEDVDKAPEAGNTRFRESMLNRVTVGGQPASNYFNGSYSGNVMTFTLKDPANRPANGTMVRHDGAFCYRNDIDGKTNAYPTLKADYIYGTKCTSSDAVAPVITTFEKVSATVDAITFHVAASDVDDEGTANELTYKIGGNNDFAEQAIVLNGEGNFTISGLKKNIHYNFTLTAIDPSGNEATKELENIDTEFDTEYNLALNKPCTGGYCQFSDHTPEGDAIEYKKANDGDRNIAYSAYGAQTGEARWQVDLGEIYNLSRIDIYFASDYSDNYQILGSFNGNNWFPMTSDAATAEGLKSTPLRGAARYVLVLSAKNNVVFKEIEIFGTGFGALDTQAPVITTFEAVSTDATSVELHIVASDVNDKGEAQPLTYTIFGDNGFEDLDVVLNAENKVTLTGLKKNCDYEFRAVAVDLARNATVSEPITVRMQFDATENLALASNGATAEAGYENGDDKAAKVNDGSLNTGHWGTYGCSNFETGNILTITLAASYNINRIVIKTAGFDGDVTHNVKIEASKDKTDWTLVKDNIVLNPNNGDEGQSFDVIASAQYIRLSSSTNHMIAIKEFEVYGSGYDDPDTEKPVITAAALVGEAGEDEATIAVTATDNVGVYACRFTDGDFSELINLIDDQCHVTGLVPGTTYTFSIIALDRAGNESEPFVMESFRTVGNDAVPHTAAPAPKQNQGDVLAIYSDAYTSAVKPGFGWNVFNGAGTSEAKHQNIGGDNYTIYSVGGGNQVGIGSYTGGDADLYGTDGHTYGENKGLNIAGYKFLHVDVWTNDSWNLTITLNDPALKENIHLVEGWNSIDLPISEFVEANTEIAHNLRWMKFTNAAGHVLAVDNIYFWIDYEVDIDENTDNSGSLSVYNNRYVNVNLQRNFAAGTLYTLCLPFSLDAAQIENAFGAGTEVWHLVSSEDRGSLIHIDFAQQNTIEAGVPYLFKPAEDFVSGTAINNVVLRNTTGTEVATAFFTMKGYVNQTNFTVAQGYYFLAADQYLHTLGNDVTSPGLRSAFTISEGVDPVAARKPARVVLGTQVTTDMPAINAEIGIEKIMRDGLLYIIREGKMYNVQGQLVK